MKSSPGILNNSQISNFPLVVIGSGLFGLTIAQNFAETFGREVLIIEKREHIGGNAWSEFDPETGIEIHKYGSHLFHTSNEKVWDYVRNFTQFNTYEHRVWTKHGNHFYSMPINLGTISQFYGQTFSPNEARNHIQSEVQKSGLTKEVSNFETAAINAIGRPLYEALINGYTRKQWRTEPRDLPLETFTRLPIRYTFDNRYFSDPHQGLPLNGYQEFIRNMVSNPLIKIWSDTDYFDVRDRFSPEQLVIYTGPIDRFFDYSEGQLSWRTLDFELARLDVDDYQGTSVMNYADSDPPFTRIHEFQHLHPERKKKIPSTVIMKEFSRFSERDDEPYYPVNSELDREKLEKYRDLIKKLPNIIFGGRLGTYKYLDMHMAIASALTTFQNEIVPRFSHNHS